MLYSLTTTALKVLEPQDEDRPYLFTGGLFDASNTVYIRFSDTGGAVAMIWRDGNNHLRLNVPKGVTVYAYTDAGTAKLAVLKEGCSWAV